MSLEDLYARLQSARKLLDEAELARARHGARLDHRGGCVTCRRLDRVVAGAREGLAEAEGAYYAAWARGDAGERPEVGVLGADTIG
jgi:hypothetical protein